MTLPRRARYAVRSALVVALFAVAWLRVSPPPVRAADPVTFGTATVTSTFLTGISISEPVSMPWDAQRIEVLVRIGDSTRTFTTPMSLRAGGTDFEYRLATPSGSIIPNTLVTMAFRVTLSDGTSVTGPTSSVRYEDTRYTWQTITGSLVRVHWIDGSRAFGQGALAIAETAVRNAAALLGVSETEPIDFFIYGDRTAFYDVLGPATRENVGASAFPEIRTVIANISTTNPSDRTVTVYLPHELTHVVFGDATSNPYHQPLLWLNEGLAVYLSQGYDSGSRWRVNSAVGGGTLMPLTALSGQFPTSADRFTLAYDEAVSAVDFMVRTYGRDAVVKLIRTYATGVSDDEAFEAGIGVDQAGFERAWLASLGAPAPSPYGPQPAPAGPLPSGWTAAAPTAGAIESPVAAVASLAPGNGSSTGTGGDSLILLAGVGIAIAVIAIAAEAAVRRRRRTVS